MATTIHVRVDAKKTLRELKRMEREMMAKALDKEMAKIKTVVFKEAKRLTPKGPLRGKTRTRDMWEWHKRGASRYTVRNRTKVFRWLDRGTRSHGAKKAGGRFGGRMFVPISSRAKRVGIKGVMGNRAKYRYGKDFVLAYRVKGIKAHKIVDQVQAYTNKLVSVRMNIYAKRVFK